MHLLIDRHTKGLTPWGLFTNLTDRADRRAGINGERLPFGRWYLHLHTPWIYVECYAAVGGPTLTYRGRKVRYSNILTRRRGEG